MWSELRTPAGQAYLRADRDKFYDIIFGGAARLARLRTCLAALRRAGATLFVLSNGFEEEINSALAHVGLDGHFATVIGA